MQLELGQTKMESFDALLAGLPDGEFNSPRRSVLPLLDYWRNWESKLVEVGVATGIEVQSLTNLAFEFPVPVAKGKGKASLDRGQNLAVPVMRLTDHMRLEVFKAVIGRFRKGLREKKT